MGTTTHTHNGHSVQCGDTHYKDTYNGIELSEVDTCIMRTPIMDTSNIDIPTMIALIMSAIIVGAVKMGVSNMGILVKDKSMEGTSILGGILIIRSFRRIRANE